MNEDAASPDRPIRPESEPGYELSPAARRPRLPGTVVVRESAEDIVDALAADLLFQALGCVRAFGDFHLALSGGTAASPFYIRLMVDPHFREFPWKRTHLWVVQEQRVPFDDERSAFREIREILVDHSDIPPAQTHPIYPFADDAAARYEAELRETLAWREKGHDRLDYALLTLDSLGVVSGGSGDRSRLVRLAEPAAPGEPARVAMTLPLLNATRLIAVMATGSRAREPLTRLEASFGGRAPAGARRASPNAGLAPLGGELRWYVDRDACPA